MVAPGEGVTMARDTRDRVKAVEHTIELLEALRTLEGAGITELAGEVELSKSSVHSHLATLRENGLIVKEGGTYSLGLKSLDLGGYVRDNHVLFDLSQSVVDGLARETGELAVLTVEEMGRSVYLYESRGTRAVSLDAHLGSRLPCHCTAAGKAIMAQLSRERVDEIVDVHGLPAFTEQTITDREVLYDELERIRGEGVSIDDEERMAGIVGIAAAITNETTGTVIGALGLTGPTNRLTDDRVGEVADLVQQNARVIEIDATYS